MYQVLFREPFMGEKQGGGGFNVLPALLTIKVDIALSKRYSTTASKQPEANDTALHVLLFMCKLFPWQKSCQILSGFILYVRTFFMHWVLEALYIIVKLLTLQPIRV